MVTSIPPHNLAEVIDAEVAMIKNPKLTTEQLMEFIQGPDFPTGGIVVNKDELINICLLYTSCVAFSNLNT